MHFNKLGEVLGALVDNIQDKYKDFECQPSSPPHDPAIQISRASYRGSSSLLTNIVSILSCIFPPHVDEIRELLVRTAALAVAVITAAIVIACRPSPSLLTAFSGSWAPHSNRCGGIDTKPQAHVQSRQ
jgi:hypothetical protein